MYMFITMLTRINVPLFFMISGALLLNRQEDFSVIFQKRISRFCLVILIFELGINIEKYICAIIDGETYDFSLKQFIYELFTEENVPAAYWYLYAYLGILFMLPFLQRIAKDIQKQDIEVLLFLHVVFFSIIPILNILLQISGNENIYISGRFDVPLASSRTFFYLLLGYYLEYYIDIKKISKWEIVRLCASASVGILLSCLCTLYEGKTTGTYTQNYVSTFEWITTITAFIIIKYAVIVAFPQLSEGILSKIVSFIGSCTFGVYLLDPYLKILLYSKYQILVQLYLSPLLVSVGWCMISMIIGSVITLSLKKIPVLKKIL